MTSSFPIFPAPLLSARPSSESATFDPLTVFWHHWGTRGALSARLSPALRGELEAIERERSPSSRREALRHWAARAERAGHPDVALLLYAALLEDPGLSASERNRLRQQREVLEGRGPWAARLEHQATHLTREVLSPASIFAMGTAGAVFRMTRLAMLTRLGLAPAGFFTRGRAASVLAGFSGFLLEAPTFSLSSQAFRSFGGAPLPSAEEFAGEVARGYLSLGGLRLGGAMSQGAARALGLSSEHALQTLIRQGGMFGGIWAGGLAEERFGFHPERDGASRLFDSLALLLHFNISARLVHEAFGPNFRAWESSLDQQSHRLAQVARFRPRASAALRDALLSPVWLAMGAGGAGGGFGGRSSRASEPPPPEHGGPREPFAWFENPNRAEEVFPLPALSEEVAVIGRSTSQIANVFTPDQRQISRRHMDLRLREDRLEIRVHDGSRGIRINDENLLPFQWYRLRDQDLVEFVSESRADISLLQQDADGNWIQGVQRLSQRPVEEVERGAVFRFRLGRPMDTPLPPRPRRNLFEKVGDLFRAGGASTPGPAPAAPESPLVRSALRESEEVYAEIARLSEALATPMPLLESALRSPDWLHADEDLSHRSRRDVLTALIRIHRRLCGNVMQRVPVHLAEPGAVGTVKSVSVPSWDGVLAQRLGFYETGLREIEAQRGPSLIADQAQGELHRIRDRLNRLFEMVRLFRRHFRDPEELAHFDAIEQAYRGLRPELRQVGERVRSMTRGLDATVQPSDRQLWTEEFLEGGPSSRAAVNLRILLGEIREVQGQALISGFYQALSSGTLYEGRRSVRFYFDPAHGQILGFQDGSPATEAAIRRLRQDSRTQIEEGLLMVDAAESGRIAEVSLLGPARESVAEGLVGLRGLRVLPPQIIEGWSGFAGDEGLRSFRLHLVPEFESPREEWYRIAGLVPEFGGGQSLLTVEPLQAGGGRSGIQVLVPRLDAMGVAVDDVLTVHEVSP